MTAWRFGLFAARYTSNVLERFASAGGHRLSEDRSRLTAIVGGLPIEVSMVVTPSHRSPLTTWRVRGAASDPVQGRISVRPKHEDEAAGLRIGDIDFDTCFLVASSRGLRGKWPAAYLTRTCAERSSHSVHAACRHTTTAQRPWSGRPKSQSRPATSSLPSRSRMHSVACGAEGARKKQTRAQ
jgi:hypothetical protein